MKPTFTITLQPGMKLVRVGNALHLKGAETEWLEALVIAIRAEIASRTGVLRHVSPLDTGPFDS